MYKILLVTIFLIPAVLCYSQEFSDPSRTEYRHDAGASGANIKSGFFQTSAPQNYPLSDNNWWHLLDVRHTSTVSNFAMQFAGSFWDQRLYFRKTLNNPSQSWSRVLLDTDGTLGVGTSTPSTRFQIVGTHPTTQLRLTLPAANNGLGNGEINLQAWVSEPNFTWDGGGIGMNVTNDGGTNYFGRPNQTIGQSFIRFMPNGGAMQFNTTSNTGNYYENTLYLTNGRVGIGTVNINDNDYKLFVEKGIRTRKVKVDQTNWPDYVFQPGYVLRSLGSLQKFIHENKHLPDLPSAREVEKNGIDIGSTQATLLRKIEELTLYVIQQQRELQNQNKKIEVLSRQLYKIKNTK